MCVPSIIIRWTEFEIQLQSTGFLLATSTLCTQIPLLPAMGHSTNEGLNSSSATSQLCGLQQMRLEEENETFERVLVLPAPSLEATVSPSGCEANEEQLRWRMLGFIHKGLVELRSVAMSTVSNAYGIHSFHCLIKVTHILATQGHSASCITYFPFSVSLLKKITSATREILTMKLAAWTSKFFHFY